MMLTKMNLPISVVVGPVHVGGAKNLDKVVLLRSVSSLSLSDVFVVVEAGFDAHDMFNSALVAPISLDVLII